MLDIYDHIVNCFFVWPHRETVFLNSSTSSTRGKWLYWYAFWWDKSCWGHLNTFLCTRVVCAISHATAANKCLYPTLLPVEYSVECVQFQLPLCLYQNYFVIFRLFFFCMMWLSQKSWHFTDFEFVPSYLYVHKCS